MPQRSRRPPAMTSELLPHGGGGSIPVAIASIIRLKGHVDVRVCAAVAEVGIADLQDFRRGRRSVDERVPIRLTSPERGAVAAAEHLLARAGDESASSPSSTNTNSSSWLCQCRWLDHAPGAITVTGPDQTGITPEPLRNHGDARRIERGRVAAAGLGGDGGKVEVAHGVTTSAAAASCAAAGTRRRAQRHRPGSARSPPPPRSPAHAPSPTLSGC